MDIGKFVREFVRNRKKKHTKKLTMRNFKNYTFARSEYTRFEIRIFQYMEFCINFLVFIRRQLCKKMHIIGWVQNYAISAEWYNCAEQNRQVEILQRV